jgi:hypothetical protein
MYVNSPNDAAAQAFGRYLDPSQKVKRYFRTIRYARTTSAPS